MKYIFLQSHYGSNYESVAESLKKLPGTCVVRTEKVYEHPTDLLRLQRLDKWAVRFVDIILENREIQSHSVEQAVVNLYVIGGDDGGHGDDYLRFRLRRLYEMWKRTGGILLTPNGWDKLEEKFNVRLERVELKGGNPIVDKYLAKMST